MTWHLGGKAVNSRPPCRICHINSLKPSSPTSPLF